MVIKNNSDVQIFETTTLRLRIQKSHWIRSTLRVQKLLNRCSQPYTSGTQTSFWMTVSPYWVLYSLRWHHNCAGCAEGFVQLPGVVDRFVGIPNTNRIECYRTGPSMEATYGSWVVMKRETKANSRSWCFNSSARWMVSQWSVGFLQYLGLINYNIMSLGR